MGSTKSFTRRLVDKLIIRFIDRSSSEEFLGDLEEMFDERVELKGRVAAETMYAFDAIHLLIGFTSLSSKKQTGNTMFIGNMLKISWRNAVRQKQFTFLNLFGLMLGIATCIAIGLYVYDETSFDNFHVNGDRIYRINQPMIWGDWTEQFASTGPGVAEALKSDIPEFEQVSRIMSTGDKTVRVTEGEESRIFIEPRFFLADENFFSIFQFPFIKGTPATVLNEPNNVVLTQKAAKKYFDDAEPIGKTIELKQADGTYVPYVVRGIVKDLPTNSHIQFDILGPLVGLPDLKQAGPTWIFTAFTTYVLVREGANIPSVVNKLQALPPKWAAATTEKVFNQSFTDFTAGKSWTLYLQPVRDIYLQKSPAHHRFGPSGNAQFVVLFSAIGVLVVALSCINFMNLSTARSSIRAKEVGVRKALGSERALLLKQFITESVLYVIVATAGALLIVQLGLDGFNTIAQKQLSLVSHFTNPWFIGSLVGFVLLLGVAAGSYPAFYLSGFQPVDTLKGKLRSGMKNKGVRNALVVFQFTVSIALIICTVFVQKQVLFSRSMDVGMSKSNVMQLHRMEQLGTNLEVLEEKLRTNPAFTEVARSNGIPPYVFDGDRFHGEGPDKPVVELSYIRTDEHYLPLLETEFLAGRNFDPSNPADKYKLIINEECARVLGYGGHDQWANNSPVGKFVVNAFGEEAKSEIIGVVKDFNFNSVKQKIQPLLVMHKDNDNHWSFQNQRAFLSMRLNPASAKNADDLEAIIEQVKADVKAAEPSLIFQYSFMDQEFDNTFRAEKRLGVILNLFTGLAITIACLGLFGLAAFSADQRKKELGIRKLHGASVGQLIVIFSAEFTKLVAIGIVLATPIAYYLTDYWLRDFANRTSIDVWVFILAGAGALAIALITVGYQSFIAASNNPAKVLKVE